MRRSKKSEITGFDKLSDTIKFRLKCCGTTCIEALRRLSSNNLKQIGIGSTRLEQINKVLVDSGAFSIPNTFNYLEYGTDPFPMFRFVPRWLCKNHHFHKTYEQAMECERPDKLKKY